ncbi:hypothetical protein GQ457_05G016190 [Hibiscus cannabinus]
MRKGVMSMREYTLKIKEVCDLLALSGRKLAELEHIATILNGLPPEFAPFVVVITASKEPFSLDGVVSVLIESESRLLADSIETPIGVNLTQVPAESPAVPTCPSSSLSPCKPHCVSESLQSCLKEQQYQQQTARSKTQNLDNGMYSPVEPLIVDVVEK